MCGIYGFSKTDDDARRMSPLLAIQMQGRGSDAWGASDGKELLKRSGPIANSYEFPSTWKRAIFHTRNATTGFAKAAENAHPYKIGNIIGIHNGIISNHWEMNKKYKRKFDVDSMHIFAHMAEGIDLKELNGYAACAWYDLSDTTPRIWLWRSFTEDLAIADMANGGVVFASTQGAIVQAANLTKVEINSFYRVEENVKYYIKYSAEDKRHKLFYEGNMKLGFRAKFDRRTVGGARYPEGWDSDGCWYGTSSSRGNKGFNSSLPDYYGSGPSPDSNNDCLMSHKSGCTNKVTGKNAICDECFTAYTLAIGDNAFPSAPSELTNRIMKEAETLTNESQSSANVKKEANLNNTATSC